MSLPPDLASVLAHASLIETTEMPGVRATRLPGLTNRVYRVDAPGGSYVVRLAGSGTDRFVDRRTESENHREAARLGLAPPVVFSDADTGTMITRLVDGAVPVSPVALRQGPVRTRLARSLRALHESDARFRSRTELATEIDRYIALVGGSEAIRSDLLASSVTHARKAACLLALEGPPGVPCHNDPAPGNALDDGQRIRFVDWEYAGINDPAWDLATAALEGELGEAQAGHLLSQYYGRSPSPSELVRFDLHRVGLDVLAGLWALAQADRDDIDFDFEAYARQRLNRALARGKAAER